MNGIYQLCVTPKTTPSGKSIQISMRAGWLRDIGFVDDTLVQFIPESCGASFILCDEHINKYSELLRTTKEKGGFLIQVNRSGLMVAGKLLFRTKLKEGDNLLAKYEHGFIRVRKLPDGIIKVVKPNPSGEWLADLGFSHGAFLSVAAESDLITCRLHENGNAQNKPQLIQAKKQNNLLSFRIPPTVRKMAGFEIGEQLLAFCEYGLIKIQKPDFVELGF